ncbi:MAG TPA: alpha/beta hydrolase [Geminicoccaceae bacterium]|nr:alpha/beta hydrolase [Geminicoccaceae bacterium]
MRSRSMRASARLAALLAALPTAGCGPKLLDALVPDGGYRIEGDIAYGDLPRQRLDVYVPDELAGPAPIVVFFYGGAWESGSKGEFRFVGQALAARGLVTVIPDYRVYPEVRFPTFVADGAAAVAWVRRHIGRLGGEPRQIHLMGHSAGAHIAALLALDQRYLAAAGVEPGTLASFVGLAGPYDFLPLTSATLKRIFEADDMAETQPITFADGSSPRALLLHGENDGTVLPANSERLAAALAAAGNRVELELYPNLDHVALVAALAAPLRWLAPVLDDVTAFLRATPPPAF